MRMRAKIPTLLFLTCLPCAHSKSNALQRASTLIVQKSFREGFGLTLREALWKGKPTIAGAVGGTPNQIIHKLTRVLVHSVDSCASQMRYLLAHPDLPDNSARPGTCERNFLDDNQRPAMAAAISNLASWPE